MHENENLHASIPATLLAETRQAATANHMTVDAWVKDALQRRLDEQRRANIFAYGKQQAQKLGIREEDVEQIVHEFRQENASNH